MSSYTIPDKRVIIDPAPEFNDISLNGDGKVFILKGHQGQLGKIIVSTGGSLPSYNTTLIEDIPDEFDKSISYKYSKFYCDYFVNEKNKIQSCDLRVTGAHKMDFMVFEILYLLNPESDSWILGLRYFRRFYLCTDSDDQVTPKVPYSKTLDSGKYALRMIYYKSELNNNEVYLRRNYMLHKVA